MSARAAYFLLLVLPLSACVGPAAQADQTARSIDPALKASIYEYLDTQDAERADQLLAEILGRQDATPAAPTGPNRWASCPAANFASERARSTTACTFRTRTVLTRRTGSSSACTEPASQGTPIWNAGRPAWARATSWPARPCPWGTGGPALPRTSSWPPFARLRPTTILIPTACFSPACPTAGSERT